MGIRGGTGEKRKGVGGGESVRSMWEKPNMYRIEAQPCVLVPKVSTRKAPAEEMKMIISKGSICAVAIKQKLNRRHPLENINK